MILAQPWDLAMQPAPMPGAFAPRQFAAPDARADGRRRLVRLDAETVVIARVVAGVPMKVAIPTRAYCGVVLRLSSVRDDGFSYEIRLAHADPDLCVTLAEADDDWDINAEWRLWARALGLPTLVERLEGRAEPDRPMLGKVAARRPAPRRRGKTMASRRPRFLTRRKVGRPAPGAPASAGEREGPREGFGGADPER
ncbi:MAG: DUF6101 family protein [Roseiarcus sp.]|jgi:hypothetical protein